MLCEKSDGLEVRPRRLFCRLVGRHTDLGADVTPPFIVDHACRPAQLEPHMLDCVQSVACPQSTSIVQPSGFVGSDVSLTGWCRDNAGSHTWPDKCGDAGSRCLGLPAKVADNFSTGRAIVQAASTPQT